MWDHLGRLTYHGGEGVVKGEVYGLDGMGMMGLLRQLRQFMMAGLPVAATAHSYHVEVLMDPQFRNDPDLQRFSLVELNELHHQVAAMGALMRLECGDPTALASLGANLQGFLENRRRGMELMDGLSSAVRQDSRMQQMMALTQVSNQQISQNWPLLTQVLQMANGAAPGPLLVHCP